jgi:predicted Mrr-cat superfamily restriction endonuclease
MENSYSLVNLDEQEYWVIRSGKEGVNLNTYRENGTIAIEHLDCIESINNSHLSERKVSLLLSNYRDELKKQNKTKGSITNNVGQVRRFLTKISIGDIIVSLDDDKFCAGIVTSIPYISDTQLLLHGSDPSKPQYVPHKLRLDINWMPPQPRKDVPLSVRNSLRANQTVFSISEHWRHINHWLSVFFEKDGKIYISSKIKQNEGINNYYASQFGILLNTLEACASVYCSNINKINTIEDEDILELIKSEFTFLAKNNGFELTSQQIYMSPGDSWSEYPTTDPLKRAVYIAAFSLLFNSNISYADSDLSNNQELTKQITIAQNSLKPIIDKIKEENQFSVIQDSLKLELPKQRLTPKDLKQTNKFPKVEDDTFSAL